MKHFLFALALFIAAPLRLISADAGAFGFSITYKNTGQLPIWYVGYRYTGKNGLHAGNYYSVPGGIAPNGTYTLTPGADTYWAEDNNGNGIDSYVYLAIPYNPSINITIYYYTNQTGTPVIQWPVKESPVNLSAMMYGGVPGPDQVLIYNIQATCSWQQFTTVCMSNADYFSHSYLVYVGGSLYGSVTLGPGTVQCLQVPGLLDQNVSVQCLDCTGGSNPSTSPGGLIGLGGNSDTAPVLVGQPSGTGSGGIPTYNPTNSLPILFNTNAANGGNGPALDASVREGLSALYTVDSAGFQKLDADLNNLLVSDHSDLQGIRAGLPTNGFSANVSLTNQVSVSVTNNLSLSNNVVVTNNISVTNMVDLSGLSNLLAQSNGSTNYSTSNLSALSWVSPVLTNYDSASAAAQQQLADSLSAIDGVRSSIIGPGFQDADSMPDMSVQIQNWTMDLNPLHNSGIAGIFAMAKSFIAWILVGFYLYRVTADAVNAIDSLGKFRGQNIQDLEIEAAGFGGNIAGIVLALVLPIAFLAGWGIVLAIAFSWSTGGLNVLGTFNSNPLATAPAGAVGLASAFFPLELMFGLTSSYLVFRLTLGRAMLVYAGVCRFLIGG